MAEHRRPRATSGAGRVAIVIGAVLAVLAVLYIGAVLAVGDGVRAGTTVSGVSIGGMSTDEAVAALEETVGAQAAKPIRVKAADQTFVISPAEAGIAFDPQATIAQASGRTYNPITLVRDLVGQRTLEPVITVDEAALESQIASIATTIDAPATEPTLTMKGRTPRLKEGKDGFALDQAALAASVRDAVLRKRKPIDAPVGPVPPTVTPEAAQAAVELARAAVANPVNVSAGSKVVSIPPDAIASALSFTSEGGQLVPELDGAKLHASIAPELADIETPGRDATFKIKQGTPVVVPSIVGSGIADDELATKVATVLGEQPPARAVSVSMGVREPALTTEEAQGLGVTEKLASFTQKFPYAAYRVQNIGQAAKNVNGTLLLPGETFSMNEVMGERTEANGYTKGFVIGPGGVFAEELGGGVSAATTAVWTGAFFAGMERVFTQAHSIYISRYQPGLEATVAWGIFDMKFRNDTPNAVFITTKMSNTSMTVTFWGTKAYDEIKAEFGPKRNIRPFQTVYDKSKECLGQGGMDGFTIDVDRVFYKDGKEVKRETITTNYRASPKVICGKKPKEEDEFALIDPTASGSAMPSASAVPGDATAPDPAASGAPAETKKPGKKPKPNASESPTATETKKPNKKPNKKPKPSASPTPSKTKGAN